LWDLVTLAEPDADQILCIEEQSFKRSWGRRSFLAELSRTDSLNYGVKRRNSPVDEPIIAYICYRMIGDEMHLLKIAVAPEWRSRGIGSWLLRTCLEKEKHNGASGILLEVRPSNRAAIALYGKMGFRPIGRRPDYYPDTREDALVLAKQFEEEA